LQRRNRCRNLRPIEKKALNFSFDVLNVTNTSAITNVTYVSGPAFGTVTDILPPRTLRAGVTFDF
jgi:outer membrane receptor protein involved in Fe transport